MNCKVPVREKVSGRPDLIDLKVINMTICEKIVPATHPAPPSLVIRFTYMIAVPFADKDLSGRLGYICASLRYGFLRIKVCIIDAVHCIDLLGTMIKGHGISITEALIAACVGNVLRAQQDRRIVLCDLGAKIRLDKGPPTSHPQPIAWWWFRLGVLRARIHILI
jgi:hypothetical protein